MTIKTSEIKEFLQASRFITNKKILPVLDYILWSGNTLIKSNLSSFCVMQIESVAADPILLDEKSLQAILVAGKSDVIDIMVSDDTNNITLKSGKVKVTYATSEAEHFPKTPEQTGSPVQLTTDTIGHIKYASMFTSKEEQGEKMRHVHVFDGLLFATNNFIFYAASIPETTPNFIVTDDALPIVSVIGECEYVSGERNDFYIAGNVTYIFIKTEHKTPGIVGQWVSQWRELPDAFTIQKSEFVSFVDTVMQINEDLDPKITMGQNHEGIDLTFDGLNSKSTETKIWANGNMEHEFTFNPKVASMILKNYPSEVMNGKQAYNEKSGAITLIFQNDSNNSLTIIQNIQR